MRRVSLRRQKLNREVADFRLKLRQDVGRCEHCLKSKAPEFLDCDEIARGSSRAKALNEPCAIPCVCRPCHAIVQPWSRAKRLALLYLARSHDYSLSRFWLITDRRFPEQEDVDREIENLLELRTHPTQPQGERA
jgi:hypothetical protein